MLRFLFPVVIGLIGTGILVSLGTWQLQRMSWKEAVIADIDARIGAAPVPLPTTPDPENDRFLPVTVTGVIASPDVRILASQKVQGAGYRMVSVLETESRRVLLDRGFAPLQGDAPTPTSEISVIGNLQWPDEVDGFTPEPDLEANIWFARDVEKLAAHLKTEPLLIIARTVTPKQSGISPLPVNTSGIPNDHLEYVITWFSLAMIWIVMTGYWLWRNRVKATETGNK